MLNLKFFNRNADIVARDLLGKILIVKSHGNNQKSIIVETEAYFDEDDPASRACKNGDLRETMRMEAGTILIYGVHNNWMFNIVTEKIGNAQAVLIRAVEPLNFNERCSGPGLLTKSISIDKSFHKQNILKSKNIFIKDNNKLKEENIKIIKSFRIGVSKDLPKKLRFFIKDNKEVSRR
ncbi:MAG: DNA-3-methyladenine glycosylase [Nanoarchaeota archaeon]